MSDNYTTDFEQKLKELKIAAIDAYMRSRNIIYNEGWTVRESGGEQFVSEYCWISFGLGSGYTSWVSRPNSDGNGGGIWRGQIASGDPYYPAPVKDQGSSFKEEFNSIRNMIDQIFNPWKELPDPSDFQSILDQYYPITKDLSCEPKLVNGVVYGSGDICNILTGINSRTSEFYGEAGTRFKLKFLYKLTNTVAGYYLISSILGGHIQAEYKIWKDTRQTVLEMLDAAIQGFRGTSGPVSWTKVFKILGWATKGFGLYAKAAGVVSVFFDIAGLGLEVLGYFAAEAESQADEPEELIFEVTGYEVQETLESLSQAMDELSKKIKAEEDQIAGNCARNLNQIMTDRSTYDLSIESFDSKEAEELKIGKREDLDDVWKNWMPIMAEHLDAISAPLKDLGTTTYQALVRDASIGGGVSGPGIAFSNLNYLFYQFVYDLAWEVRNGANNLKLALQYLDNADEEAGRILDELAKLLESGTGSGIWPQVTRQGGPI